MSLFTPLCTDKPSELMDFAFIRRGDYAFVKVWKADAYGNAIFR
jgi:hypothetical protein